MQQAECSGNPIHYADGIRSLKLAFRYLIFNHALLNNKNKFKCTEYLGKNEGNNYCLHCVVIIWPCTLRSFVFTPRIHIMQFVISM